MTSITELINVTKIIDKEIDGNAIKKNITRFLLIECQHNLNLLRLLNEKIGQYSKSHYEIFRQLESEKIELFLVNKQLYNSTIKKLANVFNKKDSDCISNDLLESILLKIKILRSISQLPEGNDIKKLKLRERSNNLQEKLKILIKSYENQNN